MPLDSIPDIKNKQTKKQGLDSTPDLWNLFIDFIFKSWFKTSVMRTVDQSKKWRSHANCKG